MARRAAAPKHSSFAASWKTSLHSSGTTISRHAPSSVCVPIARFQPPFTLTSAHRSIRAQFRAVHGKQHASTIDETSAALTSRFRHGSSHAASAPSTGANTSDCGRTSTATPRTIPVGTSRPDAASAPAMTRSAAVGPSVMTAGVYGTSAGWSATASPAASASRAAVARRARDHAATPDPAPSSALRTIATTGFAPKRK
ncbi:MAG: hypothetical protein KIT84_24865 [Labilithrix sp.]|nr:hypothetical protein [Labilithrix sp.]MCW5814282.1 hypothetical protein [Labilithrix sp.]